MPGTLTHNGARIQVLDLPGIIQGAKDGKGRGRQVIAVARTCNLIFIVLDVLKPLADLAILENELTGFGIRLNQTPPNITVKRKETGGVSDNLICHAFLPLILILAAIGGRVCRPMLAVL